MGDRNIIQLDTNGHWHFWNYGSMMPICGMGEPEGDKKWPKKFRRSMTSNAPGYNKIKNFCPVCVVMEKP